MQVLVVVALNGWNKRSYSIKRWFQFTDVKLYQVSDIKLYHNKGYWMNQTLSVVPQVVIYCAFYQSLEEGCWDIAQQKVNQGLDFYSH